MLVESIGAGLEIARAVLDAQRIGAGRTHQRRGWLAGKPPEHQVVARTCDRSPLDSMAMPKVSHCAGPSYKMGVKGARYDRPKSALLEERQPAPSNVSTRSLQMLT